MKFCIVVWFLPFIIRKGSARFNAAGVTLERDNAHPVGFRSRSGRRQLLTKGSHVHLAERVRSPAVQRVVRLDGAGVKAACCDL